MTIGGVGNGSLPPPQITNGGCSSGGAGSIGPPPTPRPVRLARPTNATAFPLLSALSHKMPDNVTGIAAIFCLFLSVVLGLRLRLRLLIGCQTHAGCNL